ncbi:hypothetical protein KUTeg_002279 [Tegillarca granosa]|uniref:Large ribosomal subunit protein uL10m n=1 Tax=Tegillarca granosa TaxID=220873 RepID=A0ABQ9FTW3_TEGGR|nr:hypothetical protein KUTeg_002279 [Tegillarca granosa]
MAALISGRNCLRLIHMKNTCLRNVMTLYGISPFMMVCQPLPMSPRTMRARKLMFQKNGLMMYSFSNAFMRRALEGTERENMIPWFIGYNVIVCCEDNKIDLFMKLVQKMPEIIPLGGLMNNKLLSRPDLEKIRKLPNIETLRGELVSILSQSAGRETHRLLGSHQQTLSTNLTQLVKQSHEDSSGKTDNDDKDE